MKFTPGQEVIVTSPDGYLHPGRIMNVYRSTGDILSLWIDLGGDDLANPANRASGDWHTPVLVLSEREGAYWDLWHGRWEVEVRQRAES